LTAADTTDKLMSVTEDVGPNPRGERRVPQPNRELARKLGLLILLSTCGWLGSGSAFAQNSTRAAPTASENSDHAPAEDSVQAFVQATGTDPNVLAATLRRDFGLELYQGGLRSPNAALSARSANPADLARLLSVLVKTGGNDAEIRFARCTLKPEAARELAARSLVTKRSRASLPIEFAEQAAPTITDTTLRGPVAAMATNWRALIDTGRSEAAALAKTLGANGIVFTVPDPAQITAAASAHTWLQIKDGEAWRDADPTMAENVEVATLCEGAIEATPTFPEALEFRISVKLVIDELDGGKFTERTILDKSFAAAELPASGLTVVFGEPWGYEPSGDKAAGDKAASDRSAFNYTPVVIAGSQRLFGSTFKLPRPSSAPADSDGIGTAAAVTDAISALSADPPATPAAAAPAFTGTPIARLRFVIGRTGPGIDQGSIERVVFDRRPDGGGAPPRSDGLSPLPEKDGEYLPLLTVTNLAALTGASRPDAVVPSPEADLRDAAFGALGVTNSQYEGVRQAIFAAINDAGTAAIEAAPGVSIMQWQFVLNAKDEPIVAHLTDVVRAAERPLATDPTKTIVDWAIASVLAERFVSDPTQGDRWFDNTIPVPVTRDILSIFKAASDAGTPLLYARGNDFPPDEVTGSAAAKLRLKSHLARGEALLLPKSAPTVAGETQLAWWIADVARGTLIDELEDGTHPELAEETMLQRMRREWDKWACRLQAGAGSVAVAAAIIIGHGDPSAAKGVADIAKIAAKAESERQKYKNAGEKACKVAGAGGGK
jgi:hypothetical protein